MPRLLLWTTTNFRLFDSMPTCFKCGVDKPVSEFYAHPETRDGHLHKCKTCTRSDVRQNRLRRVEQYRAYDRRRRPPGFVYGPRDPRKHKCRVATKAMIKRGEIVAKTSCEWCGSVRLVQVHHRDYDDPTDIEFLCSLCHARHHGEEKVNNLCPHPRPSTNSGNSTPVA